MAIFKIGALSSKLYKLAIFNEHIIPDVAPLRKEQKSFNEFLKKNRNQLRIIYNIGPFFKHDIILIIIILKSIINNKVRNKNRNIYIRCQSSTVTPESDFPH